MNRRSVFFYTSALALFVCSSLSVNVQAQVFINEIVASNIQGLQDEDGDYPDWIELFNASDSTVNLSGYGISDDIEDPFKYLLPDFELVSGQYYVLFASDKDRGSQGEVLTEYWETVVRNGDSTRYLIPQSAVSNEWVNKNFDDSGWSDGTFGLGYGDGDDATVVDNGTLSVFSRTTFTIDDISSVQGLMFHVSFDDGYVAYLNGVEISRSNMTGTAPISYNASASDLVEEAALIIGAELTGIDIEDFKDELVDGENVLAIQVHNISTGSSDLSLIPFLSVSRETNPAGSRGIASEINLINSVDSYPHTNFKLSSAGETLVLTNPDSMLIDEITYPELKMDESYGRSIENDSTWYIFTSVTPAAENAATGFISRLPKPEFNIEGGVFSDPIELSLSDTSIGDIVYFTIDGTEPTTGSLKFGKDSRTVGETFSLKFKTIQSGMLSSEVVTNTYVIGASHSLPVVSVSTAPDNLWSDETGIYVVGTNGISGNCTGPSNFNQDWEIPINIELFETDGTIGFNSRAGAKIFGGCSRTQPQKSLSIFFRGEYGNPELDYRIFEEKDIDKFQGFVLRNSGNDFNNTHFRDALMTTLVEDTEVDYQAYRPAVVYLNGEYWGIHNIREKVNEHFVAANSNGKADDVDLVGPRSEQLIHGSNQNYLEFLSAIGAANMNDPEQYQTVEDMIDIDNYIDYQAVQIYFANTDWPGNNIKYWRNSLTNTGWRWILYDTDFGFNFIGTSNHNTIAFATNPNCNCGWPNPSWSTYTLRQFLESDIFTQKFVNRLAGLMNTVFDEDKINATIDSLSQVIAPEMALHKDRWGGDVTGWEGNIGALRNFANARNGFMESHIQSEFDLSLVRNLSVHVSNSAHGDVKVNRIVPVSYPWVGRYFSGMPIEVTAIPKPGYEFTGWSGSSTSQEHKIFLNAGDAATANFQIALSENSTIVVNEIMYNSSDESNSGDWVELFNAAGYDIDLSGWTVKDDDDTHEYIFPEGSELKSGEYLVVVEDFADFNSVYENVSPLYGELGFKLSGSSDKVRIYNHEAMLIDSLEYSDEEPWPLEADGMGYSLELVNSYIDNTSSENWRASNSIGGSPAAENSVSVANEEESEETPSEIVLDQNYPNPFNPSTNIRFQLPEQSKVRLAIFDMLGREVSVLDQGIRPAGTYTLSWNASRQASGLYFYRLEVGEEVYTKKMLLIK